MSRTIAGRQKQDRLVGRFDQERSEIDAGWGDKMFRIRGIVPLVLIMLAVALYFSATLMLKQSELPIKAIQDQSAIWSQQHGNLIGIYTESRAENKKEHQELLQSQIRIADSLDEQVFLQSLAEKDRQKYNIAMPDSLRRKLKNDER